LLIHPWTNEQEETGGASSMVTMKQSRGGLARGGLYLVAASDGDLRALVDEDLAMWMPNIRRMVSDVEKALHGALPRGVAICMRFERAPVGDRRANPREEQR
jgi:hypothetical protein